MSGGSHNYIYRRMEYGDILDGEYNLETVEASLRRHLSLPATDVQIYDNKAWRTATSAEMDLALRGGAVVLAKWEAMNATIARLKEQAKELAEVAHAVEWSDSGDTMPWDVLEEVSKFAPRPS